MDQGTQRVIVLNARPSFSSALETSSHQPIYSGELILHSLQKFLATTVFIRYTVNMVRVSSDVCNKAVVVNGSIRRAHHHCSQQLLQALLPPKLPQTQSASTCLSQLAF